jgi:hypothetical protein
MENYSGQWTGEMHGTTLGSFEIDLKQEGARIFGDARFHEPKRGRFEYSISGIAGSELSFDLIPTANPSNLVLGTIKATARIQGDSQLLGYWKSTNGMQGTFTALRKVSEKATNVPSPPPVASSQADQKRFPRKLNDGQRGELYRAYRQIIRTVMDSYRGNDHEPARFREIQSTLTTYEWAHLPVPQWFRGCETLQQAVDFMRKQSGVHDLSGANAFINREFSEFRKLVEPPGALTEENQPELSKNDAAKTSAIVLIHVYDENTLPANTLDALDGEIAKNGFTVIHRDRLSPADALALRSSSESVPVFCLLVLVDSSSRPALMPDFVADVPTEQIFLITPHIPRALFTQITPREMVPEQIVFFRPRIDLLEAASQVSAAIVEKMKRGFRAKPLRFAALQPSQQGVTLVSLFDPATALSESLPDIANDGLDGEPHINIKADVQSLARVICTQQVKPPLSIALFGNWGSGKSFFMEQLRKEVRRIKGSLDAGSNDKPFYRDIIQIEFNAWHYVESNLWASLVSHIFENLKSPGEPDAKKQQNEQEALLEKLGSAQKQKEEAQKKLEEARKVEELAQKEVVQKEAARQEKLRTLQDIKSSDILHEVLTEHEKDITTGLTSVQNELGLHSAVTTIEDAGKALTEAKAIGGDFAKFIRVFISAPGRNNRLLLLLLSLGAVVVIPAVFSVIAVLKGWGPWAEGVKWLATFAGFVGALAKPVHESVRRFGPLLEKLNAVDTRFEAVVKEKMQAQEKAVKMARDGVAAAAREVAETKGKVKEAEEAIRAAEAALAKASPRGLLNAFIEERAASDDYRKSLGILALVRRDFEKLSNLLKGVRGNPNAAEYKNLPRIDRIILYIDDLDRCPPKQVVEVLQAVHLLLAFELFVVVVGVDPRWISRSLKKHYPELLDDDVDLVAGRLEHNESGGFTDRKSDSFLQGTARPIDYLEKIFQIPLWIKPVGGPETGALIKGLLTPVGLPRLTQDGGQQAENTLASDGQSTAMGLNPTAGTSATPAVGGAISTVQPTGTMPTGVKEESAFAGTSLSEEEVRFMSDLKWLAGTTPRAIKRYVNIYRLLRARVSKNGVREFEGNSGEPREFEAVMYLLALFNTAPLLAQKFCRELEARKVVEEMARQKEGEQLNKSCRQPLNTPLFDVVTTIKQTGGLTQAERALINSLYKYVTDSPFPPARRPTIDPYCRWYPVVSRYSFVGESLRSSENEIDGPKEK